MRNILRKEQKLSASCLSYLFILFGLLFFLPGYPVLCAPFFVTLGIYQSFQNTRETNDILFSALLPIAKRDVVKGKYRFVCEIELCSLLLMGIAVLSRMTILSGAAVYRNNLLMNANGFALGMAFVIFGLFNTVFVGGFFRTGYRLGRPFVFHTVLTFVTIGLAESLHHIPGLAGLNTFGTDAMPMQAGTLVGGIAAWLLLTAYACRKACRNFELIDL